VLRTGNQSNRELREDNLSDDSVYPTLEIITAMEIHVVVFWAHLEDGDSKILRNVGILPHHYKMLQPGRSRHDSVEVKWTD
jgi:hypothetical protein